MEIKTPYDFVTNCFLKKEDITTKTDVPNFYFPIIRILSFYPNLLSKMVNISRLQTGIPEWAVGCTIFHSIKKMPYLPKGSKYISAKSVSELKTPEIESIKKIFCVGDKHAKQLSKILKQKKFSLGEKGKKH